jgi:hypothetical protein
VASAQSKKKRTVGAKPTTVKAPKKRADGDVRERANKAPAGDLAQYIRKHPVVSITAAVGIAVLLRTMFMGPAARTGKGTQMKKSKSRPRDPDIESPPKRPRTHHFGAADMEFSSKHPDGKTVNFKFAWKKRPTDAPEADWPVDQMGFSASRPDGKFTTFKFQGKIRPIPDEKTAVGDNRPGLGWARMDFVSSAPGRDDFAFTWNRTPAGEELRPDEEVTGGRARRTAQPPAARRAIGKKRPQPVKKTMPKKKLVRDKKST